MDCLALLKLCRDTKSPTLANATQHFISTQLFGPHYFQSLVQTPDAIARSIPMKKFLPELVNNLNAYKSEEVDGHLSKSAAEFLLDPWLLIQLPWNAALLHQWLTAALAEVYMFKKEATKFQWWPTPRSMLSIVCDVLQQVEVIHYKLMMGIEFVGLSKTSAIAPEVSHAILEHLILPIMPTLEMLASKKLLTVIEALKKIAWPLEGGSPQIDDCNVVRCHLEMVEESKTACGFGFWQDFGNLRFQMFEYFEDGSVESLIESLKSFYCPMSYNCLIRTYHNLLHKEILPMEVHMDREKHVWLNHPEDVIDYTEAIVTAEIGGEFDFDEFSFKKNKNYVLFATTYIQKNLSMDFLEGVGRNDLSAIHNINHLQHEFWTSDLEARVTGFVYVDCITKRRQVYLRAPTTRIEPITLDKVTNYYKKSSPEEWTEETLKMKFPEECRAGISSSETCPDVEALGYEAVIKIFEVNIILVANYSVFWLLILFQSRGLKPSF